MQHEDVQARVEHERCPQQSHGALHTELEAPQHQDHQERGVVGEGGEGGHHDAWRGGGAGQCSYTLERHLHYMYMQATEYFEQAHSICIHVDMYVHIHVYMYVND